MEDTSNQCLCSICQHPVLDGEARYSRTENHYDCEFPKGQPKILDIRDAIASVDAALTALTGKPPKRISKPIGQGATATKVKALVFDALKEYFEGEPTDVVLWVQPPSHRGPRWDLACWGLHCKYQGTSISVHSWSTMGHCAKSKELVISDEGCMSFNVEPLRDAAMPQREIKKLSALGTHTREQP